MLKKLKSSSAFKCLCQSYHCGLMSCIGQKDFRIDCVANIMSMKQYELIRRYLHANDNSEKGENSLK